MWRPKTAKPVNETRPDRLGLKRDFQNYVRNFPRSNIKKVTDMTSSMAWDRRKRHVTAKNGKTAYETGPDPLHLKWDFQNRLWNFSSSNIKKVTDLTSITVWDCRKWRVKHGQRDFQNCLWNCSTSSIKDVMNLFTNINA